MKVEDQYRAALIEYNDINVSTKEPAPRAFHLYLFPEAYVAFKEETLPGVVKYKIGAIGASQELPRPLQGLASTDWPHGWRLEGMSGYCLCLTEKHVVGLRHKFMEKLIEPSVTKDTLKQLSQAHTLNQNYAAAQQMNQQQYTNTNRYSPGWTSTQAYYGNMSGTSAAYPTGISTTATAAPVGFWSSIGNALGVI